MRVHPSVVPPMVTLPSYHIITSVGAVPACVPAADAVSISAHQFTPHLSGCRLATSKLIPEILAFSWVTSFASVPTWNLHAVSAPFGQLARRPYCSSALV